MESIPRCHQVHCSGMIFIPSLAKWWHDSFQFFLKTWLHFDAGAEISIFHVNCDQLCESGMEDLRVELILQQRL